MTDLFAYQAHGEEMGHQLLERKAALGGVFAFKHELEVYVGWRPVHNLDGLAEIALTVADFYWQQLIQQRAICHQCKYLVDQFANARLREAFSGRVHWCQGFFQVRAGSHMSVFGMVDLVAGAPTAYLAVAADSATSGKVVLLCLGEVEKPERHEAGVIFDDNLQ